MLSRTSAKFEGLPSFPGLPECRPEGPRRRRTAPSCVATSLDTTILSSCRSNQSSGPPCPRLKKQMQMLCSAAAWLTQDGRGVDTKGCVPQGSHGCRGAHQRPRRGAGRSLRPQTRSGSSHGCCIGLGSGRGKISGLPSRKDLHVHPSPRGSRGENGAQGLGGAAAGATVKSGCRRSSDP